MMRNLVLVCLFLLTGNLAAFGAEPANDASRGELLYTKACVACHTTQVHWRDKKLATDWKSLQAQVGRATRQQFRLNPAPVRPDS